MQGKTGTVGLPFGVPSSAFGVRVSGLVGREFIRARVLLKSTEGANQQS